MGKTIKEIKEKRGQKNAHALEFKRFNAEIKVDEEKGIIEAYVSIFDNVDLGGDKILKGAFKDSLKQKLPKGVWSHNWDQPIAKTLKAKEDDKGLYIKGAFNLETQRGKEAFSDIKFGIIDEFSIGFRIQDAEYETVDGEDVRVLKRIKLYEWSPVLAGMNPATELVSVKDEIAKESKVKFIEVNKEKRNVKVYYMDGSVDSKKMSNRYFKYLLSLDKKGEKVDAMTEETKKIIRIVSKQIDKGVETILRITK